VRLLRRSSKKQRRTKRRNVHSNVKQQETIALAVVSFSVQKTMQPHTLPSAFSLQTEGAKKKLGKKKHRKRFAPCEGRGGRRPSTPQVF